jgi:hypothetical protein
VVSWTMGRGLEMAEGRRWKPHPLQPDLEPPERAESLAEACFQMRLICAASASYRHTCVSVAGTCCRKGRKRVVTGLVAFAMMLERSE